MKNLLLMALLSPVSLSGTHYTDGITLSGFMSEGSVASADSTVDLSDLPRYGKPVEWKCAVMSDRVLVQTFGDRWMRYVCDGDSLVMTHRENAREYSDFKVYIQTDSSKVVGERDYIARSRRDMSFTYTDSGTFAIRRFVTPLLILAEGDTVRDCPGEERVFRYERRGDGDNSGPAGTICDTETLWGLYAATGPLAASFSRYIRTARVEGLLASRTFVFPRDINGKGIQYNQGLEPIKTVPDGYGAPRPGDEPDIAFGDREISISTPERFGYTLCDISGRVVSAGESPGGTVRVALAGLSSGEYVVRVSGASWCYSRTILVR